MSDVKSLLRAGTVMTAEAGKVIIKEDENPKGLMIMLSGKIGIYTNYRKQDQVRVAELLPGEFFGEMSLFLDKRSTTTLKAESESIYVFLNSNTVMKFFCLCPETTFSLMKALCGQMYSLNSENKELTRKWRKLSGELVQVLDDPASAESVRAGIADLIVEADADRSYMEPPSDYIRIEQPKVSLFPPGHGTYELNMNKGSDALALRDATCPVCGHTFKNLIVRPIKLAVERTDIDQRVIYKGIEPIYYDIVTCPKCFYSVPSQKFKPEVSVKKKEVREAMLPYVDEFQIQSGEARDTFAVFVGCYLAIISSQFLYRERELTKAQVLLKLYRIYTDCGDKKMAMYTAEEARKQYFKAFETSAIDSSQLPKLYHIIAELSYSLKDYVTAKNYFMKTKLDRNSTAILKDACDDRIHEIRSIVPDEEKSSES